MKFAPTIRISRTLTAICPLVAVSLQACDGAPSSPGELNWRVEIVSGNAQSGLAGRQLVEAIVIRTLDGDGQPVTGVPVEFEVLEGGGTVSPVSTHSFAFGRASAEWTLGAVDVRTQKLVARIVGEGCNDSAIVEATTLKSDETDIVVFRDAIGPLRGVLILGEDRFGNVEILQAVLPSDTVVPLQPIGNNELSVLVYPGGNPPKIVPVSWTEGIDSVFIDLQQPFRLQATFNVFEGPFEERMAVIREHMARAEEVWDAEGMGIEFGEITYVDRTAGNPQVDYDIPVDCGPPMSGTEVLVDYIHLIGGGIIAGHGCRDQVVMGVNSADYPYLLAHEIGHIFSLRHRAVGLMANPPGAGLTDGEVFRSHFDQLSVLNWMFEFHPEEVRRPCAAGVCLPIDYQLPRSR